MGVAKLVVLPSGTRSMGETRAYLKERMWALPVGKIQDELLQQDLRAIWMMSEHYHPEYSDVQQPVYFAIGISPAQQGATHQYRAEFVGGVSMPWAPTKWLGSVNHWSNLLRCLRWEVWEQTASMLNQYRAELQEQGSLLCLGGVRVEDPAEVVADHVVPFSRLARDFWEAQALPEPRYQDMTSDHYNNPCLVDRELAERFKAYHSEHARFQPATRSMNSSKGSRDWGEPFRSDRLADVVFW